MAWTFPLRIVRQRWKTVLLLLVLGTGLFFAVTGCTSVIYPPESPKDPVPTYLLMDDRHRGVLLPLKDGGFVEYGYGDWDWYANNHDHWYHVFDTVLWPTEGALGRRFSAAKNGDEIRRQFPWMELHEFMVDRKNMEGLSAELAAAFAKGAEQEVYNSRYQMSFVHHEDGYWCLCNCNDVVARWLEVLGCSVSWVPIRMDLEVAQPR